MNNNYRKKISLLDWGIILATILLLLAVYLPQSVWKEEKKLKKEGRHRMASIVQAEEFYFEITGQYTLDGKHLFELVEAAMDSLIADSLFTGEQIINLHGVKYPVIMERGFEIRVDTTFSFPTELYFSFEDTIYTVGLNNQISGETDTVYINRKDLVKYQANANFSNIYSTDIVNRSEIRTDYLRKKYHLNNEMLYCPILTDPYIFEIDTTGEDPLFIITSPLHLLDDPYTESRFILFTFEAGDHGYIRGGKKSWVD